MAELPFASDPALVALLTQASFWLGMAYYKAGCYGLTVPVVISENHRVVSGYMSKALRTDVAHRTYRDGLVTPPRRECVADAAVRRDCQALYGSAGR